MEDRLRALEIDFMRRNCSVSRLEKIRNEKIRSKMKLNENWLNTIDKKKLLWYVHQQRIPDSRWPLRIFKWDHPRWRKRGRTRTKWKEEVEIEEETRTPEKKLGKQKTLQVKKRETAVTVENR